MSEENKVNESIEEKIVHLRTDKIPFEDFIKGYIKCTSVTLKDRYIKEKLKINNYVPYDIKRTMAMKVVETSYIHYKDDTTEFKIDSCEKHLLYVYSVLMAYTNIEITGKEGSTGYDILKSTGLWKEIFSRIPEEDLNEYAMVLNMVHDDFVENNLGINMQLHKFLETTAATINNIDADSIVSAISMLIGNNTK